MPGDNWQQSDNTLPVALLHGCGGSAAHTFVETGWIDALAETGRIPCPITLLGHAPGASSDPAVYGDLAGDALEKLPERFDAIGYSLGGKLLLDIAARAPHRVNRLVIGGVGDNIFAPEKSAEATATALEDGINESTPAPVVGFYRYCQANGTDLKAIAAVLRRPPNPVFDQKRLANISAPILMVIGETDPIAMPAETLISTLPSVQTEILPGVDHLTLPEQPEFIRLALNFINTP